MCAQRQQYPVREAAGQRGLSTNRARVAMVGQLAVLTSRGPGSVTDLRVSSNCRGMFRRPDLTKRYHSEFI
jgi:hypothetical protein